MRSTIFLHDVPRKAHLSNFAVGHFQQKRKGDRIAADGGFAILLRVYKLSLRVLDRVYTAAKQTLCRIYGVVATHQRISVLQQVENGDGVQDISHLAAPQEDPGRTAAGHRQLLETAALQRQRAAVGVDGAERALTAGLFLGIRDGQALSACFDRSSIAVEFMPIQINDERYGLGTAEINFVVASAVSVQRQRAADGHPCGNGIGNTAVGRIAHPCQDAVLIAVQAFAAFRVDVGAADDLDFLDRIVIFQFPCIFQKRSVLPEGIALCQQVAQFDRLVAYIRDLIVSTAVEACSISALDKRQFPNFFCAGRTDKPAVRAGYRHHADIAVIACPSAQIQCTVHNDKYLIHADKTAAARNDQ